MQVQYRCRVGIKCFFLGGRKTLVPSQEPPTNSTHIWYRARIKPGPQWSKPGGFTTTSSLLPEYIGNLRDYCSVLEVSKQHKLGIQAIRVYFNFVTIFWLEYRDSINQYVFDGEGYYGGDLLLRLINYSSFIFIYAASKSHGYQLEHGRFGICGLQN